MVDGALLLQWVLWLPAVGALLVALWPDDTAGPLRAQSFGILLLQFVLAAWLYARFDAATPSLQFATQAPWIPGWGVSYSIGLDGVNLLLVLLTAFLGPLVVAGATHAIDRQPRLFHALLLLLQFTMTGALLAQDLFLFYVFWEAMLIPMFLLIGIWGGPRRVYATWKFVLYTAFGSILMLAAVIALVLHTRAAGGAPSFAFDDLMRLPLPASLQGWLFLAFALAFAIKVPMVPLHTWLPDAHVEAPTAGSVVLAGVLLKMGTYGFMKLGLPLFPLAAQQALPWLAVAAVVGILVGACLALVQDDIKKIIAYSSISHLGYVMLGLASVELIGIQGAVLQMVSHGLVAAALFLLVGMAYERAHTRELAAFGGLARRMPRFSALFMLFVLASIGLPGTSGFSGEFLVLLGNFQGAWAARGASPAMLGVAVAAVVGVVLGALYMLRFAGRFVFGPGRSVGPPMPDLGPRELAVLAVLAAAVLWLGLAPGGALERTEAASRAFQQRLSSTATASPAAAPTVPTVSGVAR